MRRALAIFPFFLATMLLHGEEPAPRARPSSPIDAAKRDYDAIKAARVSPEQEKLELPKATTPELRVTSEPMPFIPLGREANSKDPAKRGAHQQGKSANWLLDAMNGNRTSSSIGPATAAADELSARDYSDRADNIRNHRGETGENLRQSRKHEAEKKPVEQVANPLDNFMSTWMTPGDYELLKSTNAAAGNSETLGALLPRNLADQFSLPSGRHATTPTVAAGLALHAQAASSPSALHKNPYLQDVVISPGDASRAAPNSQSVFSFSPPAAPNQPSSIPALVDQPAKAATPSELLKARDDAKYFPQLKRF